MKIIPSWHITDLFSSLFDKKIECAFPDCFRKIVLRQYDYWSVLGRDSNRFTVLSEILLYLLMQFI